MSSVVVEDSIMSASVQRMRRPDMIFCGQGTVRERIRQFSNYGSEASLVQNGHFSSVSASKRTLNSQENIAEAATKSTLNTNDSYDSLSKVDDVVVSSSDFNCPQSVAGHPSYLKLSRAIVGYTPYNTYVSSAEHERIRTEKNKTPSSGKQVKDAEIVLQNGDVTECDNHCSESSVNRGSTGDGRNISTSSACDDLQDWQTAPFSSASLVTDSVASQDVPSSLKLTTQATDNCTRSASSPTQWQETASVQPVRTGSDVEHITPKDGRFFLSLVDSVELRLKDQCARMEQDLQAKTSEEAEGQMRAAVGKANLLMRKKFQKFRQLCHANLNQKEGEPFNTTIEDLSGFWDIVLIEVEDVEKQFEDIEKLRQTGWKETELTEDQDASTPVTKTSGTKMKTPKSLPSSKSKSPSSATASPSSSSSSASKAREEARRRLMAAKAAGRQRKASESDKDIEIFVS